MRCTDMSGSYQSDAKHSEVKARRHMGCTDMSSSYQSDAKHSEVKALLAQVDGDGDEDDEADGEH